MKSKHNKMTGMNKRNETENYRANKTDQLISYLVGETDSLEILSGKGIRDVKFIKGQGLI